MDNGWIKGWIDREVCDRYSKYKILMAESRWWIYEYTLYNLFSFAVYLTIFIKNVEKN